VRGVPAVRNAEEDHGRIRAGLLPFERGVHIGRRPTRARSVITFRRVKT
jgi:hypothetical protein